jgi:6-phosphofructokinase
MIRIKSLNIVVSLFFLVSAIFIGGVALAQEKACENILRIPVNDITISRMNEYIRNKNLLSEKFKEQLWAALREKAIDEKKIIEIGRQLEGNGFIVHALGMPFYAEESPDAQDRKIDDIYDGCDESAIVSLGLGESEAVDNVYRYSEGGFLLKRKIQDLAGNRVGIEVVVMSRTKEEEVSDGKGLHEHIVLSKNEADALVITGRQVGIVAFKKAFRDITIMDTEKTSSSSSHSCFLISGTFWPDGKDGDDTVSEVFEPVSKHSIPVNPYLLFKPGVNRGNITIDKNTIIIAMGGGDTAGLNDFIAYTVEKLAKQGYRVIGVRNGFKGFKNGRLEDNLVELTPEIADRMKGLPSIAIGSCRGRSTPEDITKIVDMLKPSAGAIVIGGNGHLKEAGDIAVEAKKQNIDITVVGVPKSIDNDFMTDMLGFWSAVITGRQITARASINPNKENSNKVAVFHCMGRRSGFLALELSKGCPYPRAIIVPEKSATIDDIIDVAKKGIKNFFVAEGFFLSKADPKIGQLLDAYPALKIIWEESMLSPDKDAHGNPKLICASLFIKGILEYFCGVEVEKTDLTYQLRGAFLELGDKGAVFDTFLAKKFSAKAVSLITTKQSGLAVVYNEEYGDTSGETEAKPIENVYKSRALPSILSDESLAGLGVLGISGYPIKYDAIFEPTFKKEFSLKNAIRKAFYGIAVSTLAHNYASVAEFREPSDVIISGCGKEQAGINEFSYDLKTVIEGTRDSVLVLIPEAQANLTQIADRIKDICGKLGYINIAISKDFMLDPEDRLLKSVLDTDPVLKARFEEGIVDEKTGLIRFESGVSNFIAGLFKYLIKQGDIKVEGMKITDLGYAFKGLIDNDDFDLPNRVMLDSAV